MDDPAFADMTAEQLLDLVPEDSGCVYLAVMDVQTATTGSRVQDRTLLMVSADPAEEDRGRTFRARVSDFASIDANLSVGNATFGEYAEVGFAANAYPPPHGDGSQRHSLRHRLHGKPTLTEMLPGTSLKLGSMSSGCGKYLLVNQDDGDVVIYHTPDGTPVWRTGTQLDDELRGLANRLVLRSSGDLVVFAPTGVQLWSSGTQGQDVRRAVLGNDGRLRLIGADGAAIWSSEPVNYPPID
ncbi:hypothetical protein AB0L14_28490 [Streptomyces sp. NPDC052727]|uniref:DUF6924 domain-containing protein n=1 Tax=Streptomyces sp. NPDC052727 TaxID=3154854 RepID=UPI00342F150F